MKSSDSSDESTEAIVPVEARLSRSLGDDTIPQGEALGYLLVVAGAEVARVYPLDASDRIIGRGKSADILVPEKAVSTRHASVGYDGKRHYVRDLGSTNKTFVNDAPVRRDTPLRVGDALRVGETVFVYLASEPTTEDRTLAFGGTRLQRSVASPKPLIDDRQLAEIDLAPLSRPSSIDDMVAKYLLVSSFLKRYWRVILVPALLFALLGAAYAIQRPPAATAKFEIVLSPEARENPLERHVAPSLQFFEAAERSFVAKELVAKTLAALGKPKASKREIAEARDALGFESIAQNTYRGTFEDEDPTYAANFLREHVKLFLESEFDRALKVMRSEVALLTEQVADSRKKLRATEEALRKLKEANPDGLPEQTVGQVATRIDLRTRSAQLAAQIETYRGQLRAAREQLASGDAVFERKVTKSETHEQQLAAVRQQLIDARARGLGDQHPEVIKLKAQARDLERLRNSTVNAKTTEADERANPARRAAQARISELEAAIGGASTELGGIGSQLSQLDKVAKRLPEVETKYLELTRTYDATKTLHSTLFEQLKARELQLSVERASVERRYEIIEPPSADPINLRRAVAIRASIGGVFGTALGVALSLLLAARAYLRRRSVGKSSSKEIVVI